uniref:GRIP domain-containing protein n=1 Tax=Rhabditophanes sp. KR3021 TaxID=114890 RepID=A0AC35TW84_9BILA
MNNWFFGGSKKDPIPDKNNSDSDWEHYKNNKLATNTYNDTCSNGRIIPANISPEEPFQDLSKHDNTVVGNVAKYVESLSDSDDDEILKHQTDVKVHCSNASNVQKYDPNANSSDDEILLDKKNTEPNYEKLYRIEVDERKHYANEIMEKDKKIAELNQVVEEKVQKTSILRNELSSARDLNTELFNDVKKLEFEIENWKQSSINKHNEALSNLEKIKVNENVYREEAEVAKMNAVKNLKIFEDKNRQQRDAMQRNFDELNNEYSKVVNNHKDLQREYAYMDNNHREQYQNESRTNMKISRQLKEANDKIETYERQIAQMTKRVTELELIVEKQSEDARLATVRGNGLRDMISLKDILDGKIDSNSSSDEDEDLVLDRKIDSNSPAKYTEEKVNDSPAKYVEEKVNDSPAKYVEKDQMESDDKDIEEDLLEKIYILLNSKYTKEEILREFNLCNKNIGVTFQTLKNRSTNSN